MGNIVVLITGAGSGIGEATAHLFAEKRARVVVADMNEREANKVADEIKTNRGKAFAMKCDISDEEQVKAMMDNAVEINTNLLRS